MCNYSSLNKGCINRLSMVAVYLLMHGTVGDINPLIHKLFGLARPTFVVNIWRSRSQGRGFKSCLPT